MAERLKLKARADERFRVTARVDRSGSCVGYKGRVDRTILLRELRDHKSGELLADHMWFKKGVWSMYLRHGDKIAFDARVASYIKAKRRRDWRMQRPTKIERI